MPHSSCAGTVEPLAGHMQQDLVDERGWVRKEDYLEGLALAQLAPGPLAAQLAIYLGYIRAGVQIVDRATSKNHDRAGNRPCGRRG